MKQQRALTCFVCCLLVPVRFSTALDLLPQCLLDVLRAMEAFTVTLYFFSNTLRASGNEHASHTRLEAGDERVRAIVEDGFLGQRWHA